MVGALLIVCLLFADDVLLFASSKKEAEQLLKIVTEFVAERNLVLNSDKTKAIGKDEHLIDHPLLNSESWQGHLKHLGLYVGVNQMWTMQREQMIKKMVQKRNAMHAIVEQTLDKVNLANIIWHGEVLPAALYGCEVIQRNHS